MVVEGNWFAGRDSEGCCGAMCGHAAEFARCGHRPDAEAPGGGSGVNGHSPGVMASENVFGAVSDGDVYGRVVVDEVEDVAGLNFESVDHASGDCYCSGG